MTKAKPNKINKYTAEKSKPKTIRFSDTEVAFLEDFCKTKGNEIEFSTLVRESAIAHVKNMSDNDQLMESLDSENPEEVQKSFFDILNANNEVVLKTLHKYIDESRAKNERLEKLVIELMYLVMYFNREIPQEEKAARQISARKRLEGFIAAFDKEVG